MATLTERLLLVVDADSKGAARGLDDVSDSAKRADRSVSDLGRTSSRLGDSLKAGLAIGAGAIIGGGLIDAVTGVGKAYLDAAKGVELFSNATNSTVEESSRFMGMAQQMGLDVNDLLEIVAEFGPKAEDMKDELKGVGIELQKNADGSVNVGRSLENALEGLQNIPDDAKRMQMAMKLFGEEGSKQLASIYNGTKPVKEALDDLDLGLDQSDLDKTRAFNEAMTDLKTTGRDLGFNLASTVIPAFTTLADVLGPIAGLIADIEPETLLLSGALLGVSRINFGPLRAGFSNVLTDVTTLAGMTDNTGKKFGTLRAAATVAKDGMSSAFSGMLNAMTPVTTGIGAAVVGMELFGSAIEEMETDVSNSVPTLKDLEDAGKTTGEALDETARKLDENASFMSRFGAELKGGNVVEGLIGPFSQVVQAMDAGGDSAQAFREELQKQAEAMGPAAVATANLALEQQDLNDLVAEGVSVNSGAFAQAVRDAADAQVEQKGATDLATDAINAYISATTGAVDATLASISSSYAQSDAFRSAQTAIQEAATTVDDGATVADEAAAAQDNAGQAALRYAAASLQAAQDQAAMRGEVLSTSEEVDVQIAALQTLAQQPGISDTTRANIQAMIDQLTTAKEKGDEGVNVQVGQTGAEQTGEQIDETAGDRETAIRVESRNGPAVNAYLNTLAKDRLAIIRVESRNGPAVISYLNTIDDQRLAIIRVESRNGPAVISYLDSIAQERLAIIRVETRNGPAVDAYLNSLARNRTASIAAQSRAASGQSAAAPTSAETFGLRALSAENEAAPIAPVAASSGGPVVVQRTYKITNEIATGVNPVEVGRATVNAIRAFEASAGRGWRAT